MRRTRLRSRPQATAPAADREQRLAERAARVMAEATPRAATSVPIGAPAAPVRKGRPIRSPAYRRAVASLPCIRCGVHGYSQAAHPNTGKGVGTKASDMDCFPLCADRPGVRGCHSAFDQGAAFTRDERRRKEHDWTRQTRAMIERQRQQIQRGEGERTHG